MKTNKALKRLTKIETALSVLIKRYPSSQRSVQAFLHDAKSSVLSAKKALSLEASPRTEANAAAKAGETQRRQPIAKHKKRASLAAKKQKAAQPTSKGAGKTKKKWPTPEVKGVVRVKAARPAVAKKAPVRQVARKAGAVTSSRVLKKKVPAKVVTQTVAESTKPVVEGSKQVMPLPKAPPQDRTPAEEHVGLTGTKGPL